MHRYIDSRHRKVMQDIVSSKLYKEQFDAIQDCFRNIGFTEEVPTTATTTAVVLRHYAVITVPLPFLLQEVNSVYRILSAILNTGNIEFAAITSQHQTDKSEVPNAEALENGEILCAVCLMWAQTRDSLINSVFCFLSGVSPQHWSGGAPGGADLSVRGHERRDHHPHQHGGQGCGRQRRHVQGFVRAALQLDRQPHQLPAAA